MKDRREKANRRPSTVVEGRMICRVEVMMMIDVVKLMEGKQNQQWRRVGVDFVRFVFCVFSVGSGEKAICFFSHPIFSSLSSFFILSVPTASPCSHQHQQPTVSSEAQNALPQQMVQYCH
jgi:hypothetical protein